MSDLVPASRPVPRDRAAAVPAFRSHLTPAGPDGGEGIPLREYLEALRRHLWLIAAAVAICVGFAVYRIHAELPRYTAGASVRLVNARQELAGDLGSAGSDGLQGWYTDPILSQIQILKSRGVAAEVVDAVGLRLRPESPEFAYATLQRVQVSPAARTGDVLHLEFGAADVRGRVGSEQKAALYGEPLEVGGLSLTFSAPPEETASARMVVVDSLDAVFAVLAGLDGRPREMTNVIDIYYTAHDPHLAQRVANAAAAAFQQVNTSSAQQSSRRRRLFIQEQLRSTDSLLIAGQRELSDFRKSVQAFSPRDKFRTTQEGMATMRLRREELAHERRIYDQMYRELASDRGRAGNEQIAALAATPEVAANAGIIRLHEQLLRYQTVRDSLTTGPWSRAVENPDVQQLDSLIATFRGRLVTAVQARSTGLQGQVAVIDEMLSADEAGIRDLPDADAEEMRLARQVETLQTLADDLLRERQRARIDEAVETGAVQLVDWAMVPAAPISAGARQRLLFALLVGLMIGSGGALVLDRMNTTLGRREELESVLHLPALGVIPALARPARRRVAFRRGRRGLVPAPREHPSSNELITDSDLHSAGSQAYRKLRTHLLFSQHGEPIRTLLVTSPCASEGKSTICANLAVTFAQQGMRVVLVDADLRRSRLHSIFETKRVAGLTEVLQGEVAPDAAVRGTRISGLHLLPAGRLVGNASELLGGDRMRHLLAELSAAYDMVIVDTPPVLAAADAEIVGVQTDAVLVVCRAGQTERQSAEYAVQQLRAIGARLVGAVLNDPDGKVPNYGRYAYYYEYYADGEANAAAVEEGGRP